MRFATAERARVRPAAHAAVALLIAAAVPARADAVRPLPTSEQEVEKQLKTFDPEAVAAARHYYESPKIKEGILSILRNLTPMIVANQEKARGVAFSAEDRAKLADIVNRAVAENFGLLIDLNMIAALESLSKEELVALDKFYSSPVGQDILTKMPQISQRLPGMMRIVVPRVVASLRNEINTNGFGKP